MPHVTITRRMHFSAAHRVHNPALSDEENRRVFGKCNNPNWHGHNYMLDVSVRGSVDARTGYVVDLGHVRDVVQQHVIDKVDHRNLNLEVDFLRDTIPTTENVVVAMWRVLEPVLRPAHLARLVLWETVNHYVEYDGQ
jgi:6-pyruvoyltetrahydropterin/6-carboxytetrahydropterin synthase